MSRAIKFRAWDELEKRMWTLDDAGEDSGDGSIQYFSENGSLEFGRLEYYDTGLGVNSHFEKFPLMQYTGLKDKNGKEIYEGDILAINNTRYVVGYRVYSGGWQLEIKNEYCAEMVQGNCELLVIIGNIYENPELVRETA